MHSMLCRTAYCVQPQTCACIQHGRLIKAATSGAFPKTRIDEDGKYMMHAGIIAVAAGQREFLIGVWGPGIRRMICELNELAAAEYDVLLVRVNSRGVGFLKQSLHWSVMINLCIAWLEPESACSATGHLSLGWLSCPLRKYRGLVRLASKTALCAGTCNILDASCAVHLLYSAGLFLRS